MYMNTPVTFELECDEWVLRGANGEIYNVPGLDEGDLLKRINMHDGLVRALRATPASDQRDAMLNLAGGIVAIDGTQIATLATAVGCSFGTAREALIMHDGDPIMAELVLRRGRADEIHRLKGLILKALDSWWPFVHGAVGASQRARNLFKELSDGIQPGASTVPTRRDGPVIYSRPQLNYQDGFTRTIERDVALAWKRDGHVVTPDPEVQS